MYDSGASSDSPAVDGSDDGAHDADDSGADDIFVVGSRDDAAPAGRPPAGVAATRRETRPGHAGIPPVCNFCGE